MAKGPKTLPSMIVGGVRNEGMIHAGSISRHDAGYQVMPEVDSSRICRAGICDRRETNELYILAA